MQRASAFLSIDRNAAGNILATSVTLNCNSFLTEVCLNSFKTLVRRPKADRLLENSETEAGDIFIRGEGNRIVLEELEWGVQLMPRQYRQHTVPG